MIRQIEKLLAPLSRRVRLMVGRCILNLVDDSLPVQRVQISILADETHDNVERLQTFGLSSVPLPGAKGAVLAVGGSRDHLLVVAMDDGRYRPTGLEGGESSLYNAHNVELRLLKDGTARLGCKTFLVQAETKVRFETPLFETSGDIVANGNVKDAAGAKSMAGMRDTYNLHTQAVSGNVAAAPGAQM